MHMPYKFIFAWVLAGVCLSALAEHQAPRPNAIRIAQACSGCHGPYGRGHGAIPSIAGMPESEFIQKMQAFRAGQRPASVMDRIARGYRDEDFAGLARIYSRN